MEFDFDAIVIGGGAGGAAFAHSICARGKRTLLIERGPRVSRVPPSLDEKATLIDKGPYDDRSIYMNHVPRRMYMGGMLGGSTTVFGGVMLRPSIDDFEPGKHYADQLPRSRWEWPIHYDDLRPYYDQAEQLFSLSAEPDDDYAPLQPPSAATDAEMLPLAPINRRLLAANRARGLRPFRLPLAIDARRCQRCDCCAGYVCPTGARRSAADLIETAVTQHGLQLLTQVDVEQLELSANGSVSCVRVRDLKTGQIQKLSARVYALAAGAIGSAAIALRSGLQSPQLGRNFMMHYSPITVGLFRKPTGADNQFVKQLGFADYYYGTRDVRHKMGIIQSLPAPGALMLKKSGLRRWPVCVLRQIRKHMLPLAGIVEDLPNPNNRVHLQGDGSIALDLAFSDFDRARGRALAGKMHQILRRAGAWICTSRSLPAQEHVGHQCGTLRMSKQPDDGVVDPQCQVFGSRNLFVVDGSVLPTSLGVGPSLTIVANALRVAQVAMQAI